MALSYDDAEAVIDEFCKTYPQALTITYNLALNQEELYGPQNSVALRGRIDGSYRAASRRADFALANCDSNQEFERTLRHEILGHYGINTFKPGEKRAVLERLIESRSEPGIEAIWATVDRAYPALDEMRKAEEVYAFACEIIEPHSRANVAIGLQSFQEACIDRSRPMTYGDLMNVTTMVAEGLHDRSRSQQNFPASDDAQFKVESAATPNTSDYPVWLAVPHAAREAVREAAGKLESGQSAIGWDKEASLWFARPGADLDRLAQWLPDTRVRPSGGDPEAEFLDALTQGGLLVKGMPVMDGQLHRVATVEDKKGKQNGAYRGFLDGLRPAGWFTNFKRSNDAVKWSATGGETDPVARLHIRATARQSQDDAQRAREQLYVQQTLAAKRFYDRLPGADPAHPYLVRKGISLTPELRQTRNGALVVPFFNASGTFKTLQYITPEGEKYLFKDAPKQGHFLVVGGQLSPGQPVLYAEGYATARSLNLALGLPVVMTIDAGNMVAVAKVLHERFPDSPHVFLADFDHAKAQNKGLLMATAAAEQIGGQVLYPAFTDDEKAGGLTDFNDLHQSRGLDALHSQIAPVLVNDNEVSIMQEEKAVLDPAATSAFVDSVLPLAAPAPLIYTHNGEPVTIDLARFQPTPQVEPPAAPVELESSVVLSAESLGAEWTANQLERLNARGATEQSVFSEVEGLLKNQKFELRTQISALRKDDTGLDSDTVKGHQSTIRAIDQALKEMRQQRSYDGDPSHLSLLDRFKYDQVGDKQGIIQGRGLDGSLRDEWVKQQLQQPGSPKGFLVVEDGRQFQVERTARTEALLSRVLVLGSNAGVTELIRDEIGVRHAEHNTVAVPAVAEEHAPAAASADASTVVQSAGLDNTNPPGTEATSSPGPVVDELAPAQRRAEEQLSMALEPAAADTRLLAPAPSAQIPEQEAPLPPDDPIITSRPVGEMGNEPSPAVGSDIDAILVGAPRPRPRGMEVEPQISHMDLDALRARLDRKMQGDTVLYTLDGEPAFVDQGSRLEMATGGEQNDEKIIAALLTAAEFYRGRIELTGSDAFKAKAIGLIAQHQINVEMKNPVQRVLLDDARKALTAEPTVRDAIAGEAAPPWGAEVQPQAPTSPGPQPQQESQPIPVASPAVSNDALPLPQSTLTPGPVVLEAQVTTAQPGTHQASNPDPATRSSNPVLHQNSEAAKLGISGKVMDFGQAPFKFEKDNTESTFIKLRTRTGMQTYWGKELAGLLRDTRVEKGRMVTLQWLGKEAVTIKAPIKKEGVTIGFEDKNTHRNQWSLTVLGSPAVRTGQDEGVKLAPYDGLRFAVVQQALLRYSGLDMPLPKTPENGLYWMTPNGQGSAKAGDELSAKCPAMDPKLRPGEPVISSWSPEGRLDMLLVRGDGPYLQGVVRQGEQMQHVLVSLPGTPGAPPMVFNAITPEGLVPIGTGNGINRAGGEAVSREHIAFKLEGDAATRIGKLDAPAAFPADLHARLGFDARYKEDNVLPKSAPTAAPSAQPNDPRPA